VSRTVFLGTSEFAGTVLKRLAESAHRPVLIVTPPDRPKGRGKRLQQPPAAAEAAQLDLQLWQTPDVNADEATERIRGARPDAVIVCAFGQIIRDPLLSEWPLLNVHPSLLPRWRGAAPIERAIMAGDATTGVCVMELVAELDAGPVALCEETPVGDDDYGALAGRLANQGGELLVTALSRLESGQLSFREQDFAGITYAEKIDRDERHLDPSRPSAELERTVRALTPHIGAYLEVGESERLGVRRASVVDEPSPAGEISVREGALILGCGEGALRLEVVQAPGGRPISAEDYLRGNEAPTRAT